MRSRVVIPLLLLLSACTGGSSEPRAASVAPSPSASSSPSALPSPSSSAVRLTSPSPAPADALMLAVAAGPGQLALYAVAPGSHAATLVRRLEGPPGRAVDDVSLSAGVNPTVCATWQDNAADGEALGTELSCYRPGATRGRVVTRNVVATAVRDDGLAVAWIDEQSNRGLFVADLAGDVATVRTRERYSPGEPDDAGLPEGISEVDWVDAKTLGLTDVADSDEGKGLCVYVVGEPRPKEERGFGRCLHPGPEEKDFARFEQAAPVAPGVVVAVERPLWCCIEDAPRPPARAARVRLSDGKVIGVVATARTGRDVVDVSGGSRAVLYTTAAPGAKDLVVSLRWADEAHGAPVTGLPTGVQLATAQP